MSCDATNPTRDELKKMALDALERAEKATAGPWKRFSQVITSKPPGLKDWDARLVCAIGRDDIDMLAETGQDYEANLDFIAAARTDVPTLARASLDEQEKNERLEALLNPQPHTCGTCMHKDKSAGCSKCYSCHIFDNWQPAEAQKEDEK